MANQKVSHPGDQEACKIRNAVVARISVIDLIFLNVNTGEIEKSPSYAWPSSVH